MVTLTVAFAAFLVAGFIKGVVGFGFPIIALVILTLTVGLLDALAIILIPTFVTNVLQGLSGRHLHEILRRMWRYFAFALLFIGISSSYLTVVNINGLTALLGGVLFVFALSRLFNVKLAISRKWEAPASLLLGSFNGVLTGLTGSFMVPSVLYMQAIGFKGELLVQAMGIFFALSTLTLALSLGRHNLVTMEHAGLSATALIPSIIGLMAGRRARQKLDEKRFQQLFLSAVLLLGAYITYRSIKAF
jgi:hypothetical protein